MRRGCWLLAALASVCAAGCNRRESAAQVSSARPAAVYGAESALAAASRSSSTNIAPPSALPRARCVTPENVGAVAFLGLSGESAVEKAAIAAAGRELKRVLEVPAEYFATVQTAGDLVLLELWHRSAFSPENCEDAQTRCAKCRTLAYDPKLRRIVATKVWEH